MLLGQKLCPDCEPAPVNHFAMRASAYLGLVFKPLFRPINYFLRALLPPRSFSLFDTAGPLTLRALAFLRLGRLEKEARADASGRTRALWTEAARRGISMEEYRFGPVKDLFIACFSGKTRCFDGLPRPVGPESESLFWMDNKPAMRARFARAGIPVSRGASCFSRTRAFEIFRSLGKPVVVKPVSGSRSRHTTVHIETVEQFAAAFRRVKVISPLVLIEEELTGFVFRGALIGGRLVAVMRREPPGIVGDGVHSVRGLVEKENGRPERRGPTFHPIETGANAEQELARQGFNWASIPGRGVFVPLHQNQKVGREMGASMTDVTDEMHPENRRLLEYVGEILKDPLVGVDFIMADVSVPWRSQKKCGVIECNSLPFIDLHHFPLRGAPRNVAGALWDIIFPTSAGNAR